VENEGHARADGARQRRNEKCRRADNSKLVTTHVDCDSLLRLCEAKAEAQLIDRKVVQAIAKEAATRHTRKLEPTRFSRSTRQVLQKQRVEGTFRFC
jgi:hypothetical protein